MSRFFPLILAGAGGLWLAWVFQGYIITALGGTYDSQALGQWGDTFGALNALFATLGFGAALYTLFLQQRQIAKDQFDKTFWELLKLLMEARDKVEYNFSSQFLRGHSGDSLFSTPNSNLNNMDNKSIAAFRAAWLELYFWMPGRDIQRQDLVDIYNRRVHNRAETTLGPYFRLLYTLFFRIETSNALSDRERVQYGNLVRGQLSQFEVVLIGLNGLSPVSKDFERFVIRYRLLKYTTGFRRRMLMKHYPKSTFLGRDRSPVEE